MSHKRRLITSALPYVNNAPHLGNIIGCVLSADVFARFCRSRGYETLYICGTDGYGTATETKAKEEGTTPREICERYHEIHEKIYQDFNISFDHFGKTFSDTHTEVVQEIYQKVKASGYLLEQQTEQAYCDHCQSFLADRFVQGQCPHCQYEHGRGDQCEACGKLLSPNELIDPSCATCSQRPTNRETRHLYLDLSRLSEKLEKWQNGISVAGKWTTNARTTTESWMKQGLQPRPITRDLKWGVPVPEKEFQDKVFYVWFDAPIGYISITKEGFPNDWKKWWLHPQETSLYQFMAKDNIPFHSVIFPATLLASQQDWTLVHHLNSTEYLNYENAKFSKSKNVGIFGHHMMDLPYPVDFWRFYLLRIRPEKQDSNFSWTDFADRINSELIDNIANLINRVLVFHHRNVSVPVKEWEWNEVENSYIDEAKGIIQAITDDLENGSLREGLVHVIHLGKLGNRFFQEQEPWKKVKIDLTEVERTMSLLIYTVRDLSLLLEPFLPESAQKIQSWLPGIDVSWQAAGNFSNLVGLSPVQPEILFKKIDAKDMAIYQARFSGEPTADFGDLDIRIGQIISAESHPKAENLIIETIDVGERTLTVVSGLARSYKPVELTGKKVMVLVNLKPIELKGATSEGMVLVATEKKVTELISDENFQVGERVQVPGQRGTAKKVVSIDTFNRIKIEVIDHKVMWADQPLMAGIEMVGTRKIKNGIVK